MILTPKRKLIAQQGGGESGTGGQAITVNYLYHHLQDSTIGQFATGETQVVDRLHVRHRLRIPVGTDMYD